MTNSVKNIEPAVKNIEPASQTPLVAPSEAQVGEPTDNQGKADLASLVAESALSRTISDRAQEAIERNTHLSNVKSAIAVYYETQEAQSKNVANGETAEKELENATALVSRAFADAIMAKALDRKTARQKLGEAFGFAVSETTGKPTSKPLEPGNTISKRVSSVTIALEYVMTGELPDKGGDSLPTVGRDKLETALADYWDGGITVRAASERIEAEIREARVTVPMELDHKKIEALAGKILTASEAIATNPSLKEAYAVLVETILAVPFE